MPQLKDWSHSLGSARYESVWEWVCRWELHKHSPVVLYNSLLSSSSRFALHLCSATTEASLSLLGKYKQTACCLSLPLMRTSVQACWQVLTCLALSCLARFAASKSPKAGSKHLIWLHNFHRAQSFCRYWMFRAVQELPCKRARSWIVFHDWWLESTAKSLEPEALPAESLNHDEGLIPFKADKHAWIAGINNNDSVGNSNRICSDSALRIHCIRVFCSIGGTNE